MSIAILLWLCTSVTLSAFGAGTIAYLMLNGKDEARRRFTAMMVGWAWTIFGLWMVARFMVRGFE